ncbi:mutarotase [Reichenbachiella agariperforans]|uniref:mutarotase n=1 Tax=Reichenbachiella agariperforans TaxID=156994 RepID=UPI001C0800EE|nr:mutarotase [Reichenbachiella agariperforans]MBU2915743.1 mutarotase [Reichenbachiella agariperforans]
MIDISLGQHYEEMWRLGWQGLQHSDYFIDSHLTSLEDDMRFGLTLRIRPDAEVLSRLAAFQDELIEVAPEQYHYPSSTIHVTGLSVISCSTEVRLGDLEDLSPYITLIQQALKGVKNTSILFQGLTLSPVGLLIQGFPNDSVLEQLRSQLREAFRASVIKHSMDARYTLKTAHTTIMRYQQALADPKQYEAFVLEHKERVFGASPVTVLELVINDWYHTPGRTKVVHAFEL